MAYVFLGEARIVDEVHFSTFVPERLMDGVLRDYEEITYPGTPTFVVSHKPSKISEARMH